MNKRAVWEFIISNFQIPSCDKPWLRMIVIEFYLRYLQKVLKL